MAHEKIDLRGHAELHEDYHRLHQTVCNHDCQYYEEIGNFICGECHLPWNIHPHEFCKETKS